MIPPLTSVPFPIFGLDTCYKGARWLDCWNRLWSPDGPLWTVSLGHGQPGSLERVVVFTDAKLPAYPTATGFIGPTGIDDARRQALVEMVVMATPEGDRNSAEFRDAVQMASGLDPDFEASTSTVEIDGKPVAFQTMAYRRAWAASGEVNDVAIGVVSAAVSFESVSIAQVNHRLSDYQPILSD